MAVYKEEKTSTRRNEGSKQSVKHRLESENSLTSWAVIWI